MIGGEHPIHVNLRLLIGLDLIPLDLILLSNFNAHSLVSNLENFGFMSNLKFFFHEFSLRQISLGSFWNSDKVHRFPKSYAKSQVITQNSTFDVIF